MIVLTIQDRTSNASHVSLSRCGLFFGSSTLMYSFEELVGIFILVVFLR